MSRARQGCKLLAHLRAHGINRPAAAFSLTSSAAAPQWDSSSCPQLCTHRSQPAAGFSSSVGLRAAGLRQQPQHTCQQSTQPVANYRAGSATLDRRRQLCSLSGAQQQWQAAAAAGSTTGCTCGQRRQLFSFPGGSARPKEYNERKLLQFSPEQLYDVVARVDTYKEFVPWCQRSVITHRWSEERVDAELEVGFKMFVERYTSQVYLHRPDKVISKVSDSTLFDHLDTTWKFEKGPTPNSCWLSFQTDFRFRSPLYAQVANVFFDEVVKRMMAAFEQRCMRVYGEQKAHPGSKQQQRLHAA